jgi:hypothetical protein
MDSQTQKIIDFLLDKKKDGGWPWGTKVDLATQELAARFVGDNNQSGPVMRALEKMDEEGETSASYFAKEVENFRSTSNSGDDESWKIFIPVQIELGENIPQNFNLKICGTKFSFEKVGWVSENFSFDPTDREELGKAAGILVDDTNIESFVTATCRAENRKNAWKEIESSFDAFKGFTEFQFNIGGRSWGGDDPRALVPHPKWYLAQSESGRIEVSTFIVSKNKVIEPVSISEKEVEAFQERSVFMKEVPQEKTTESLIVDSLRLYSQAMDHRFRDGCFLGLWQVLETIALSDEVNGKTRKIRARVEWHGDRLGLPGSGIRNTLNVLADKRNDVVHRGIKCIEDDDINVLKILVETALYWLIGVKSDLPTVRHLSTYYKFRTAGDTEIDSVSDTLDYIQDAR